MDKTEARQRNTFWAPLRETEERQLPHEDTLDRLARFSSAHPQPLSACRAGHLRCAGTSAVAAALLHIRRRWRVRVEATRGGRRRGQRNGDSALPNARPGLRGACSTCVMPRRLFLATTATVTRAGRVVMVAFQWIRFTAPLAFESFSAAH